MIRGKFLSSMDDCAPVFDNRYREFCEEQGFSRETEIDACDQMAIYALAYDADGNPAGTGRLCIKDDRFSIGRVCVLKHARGQGLGDLILRMLLYRAQELNAPEVYLESQLPAVDFYRRFGFEPMGEVFLDEGVAHRRMKVSAQDIRLEGSCQSGKHCSDCQKNCRDCT